MTTAGIMDPSLSYTRDVTGERKILVVEDDPEWQLLIGSAIRKYDESAQVKYAYSARGAKYLLNQNPGYDLVISDHYLEGDETGLELWRECQQKYHDVPFMMMSGLTEHEFLKLIKKENNYPLYLSKQQTFQFDQLQNMLTWHLGEPMVRSWYMDQRFVLVLALIAMIPFLGVSFTSVNRTTEPAPPKLENEMEQKLRRTRTAFVEKIVKPKIAVSTPKHREAMSKVQISDIISKETKDQVNSILSRADEIISESRQLR